MAVQAAFHRLAIKLGLAPEPARRDGYVPRERRGIWSPQRVASLASAQRPTAAPIPAGEFPPLERLGAFVNSINPRIEIVMLLMPYHVSALPAPGSPAAAWLDGCKARIAAIAKSRPRTVVVDHMREDDIARDASNFWDASHARDHIMRLMEGNIAAVLR